MRFSIDHRSSKQSPPEVIKTISKDFATLKSKLPWPEMCQLIWRFFHTSHQKERCAVLLLLSFALLSPRSFPWGLVQQRVDPKTRRVRGAAGWPKPFKINSVFTPQSAPGCTWKAGGQKGTEKNCGADCTIYLKKHTYIYIYTYLILHILETYYTKGPFFFGI